MKPPHVFVTRATSAPAWSLIEKFHARQFSAKMPPAGWSPTTNPNRILPKTFSCTISPIGESSARVTRNRDLNTFVGRVIFRMVLWLASRTSKRWLRNWSYFVSSRMAFRTVLCPTSTTPPILVPCWSNTPNSLAISMSLARWLTTRTGSVNSVPPPGPVCVPPVARATWFWIRLGSWARSMSSSMASALWDGLVLGVQAWPFHHRCSRGFCASGYQPGAGGEFVMAGERNAVEDPSGALCPNPANRMPEQGSRGGPVDGRRGGPRRIGQVNERPWPIGAATAIGSMPGTDPGGAAAGVFGELPDFPQLPGLHV